MNLTAFLFPLDVGHLKVEYGDNNRRHLVEESSLDSIAAVVVPVVIGLSIIIAFLLINQKKQWVPLLCWYRTPTKVSSCHHSSLFRGHTRKACRLRTSLNCLTCFMVASGICTSLSVASHTQQVVAIRYQGLTQLPGLIPKSLYKELNADHLVFLSDLST